MKNILFEMKKSGRLIKDEEFDDLFYNTFDNMRKQFTKLEVEQYYKCDMDEDYNRYINGNYDHLIDTFKDFFKLWPSIFMKKQNIDIKRLHLITKPNTKYIDYEMYFYLMNEKAGEKVRCLYFEDTNYKLGELDDFIIFDEDIVIINCHKNNGEYLYSYYYDKDKALIRNLLKKYKDIYEKGNDYKNFIKFDEKLIEQMKNNDLI